MLTNIADTAFAAVMGSRLITEACPDYDISRRVWNGMIDRRPAAIAMCRTVDEVRECLRIAREGSLSVSIRGGGHNIAGTAIGEGAFVIDLSEMARVEIDPAARIGHVGGGATWADFDAAAQIHGLAAPGGVVSSTGVAGLTLGGGFGWLARRFGLAIDNLIAVELVLADGRAVTASSDEHPDLFWAIRGGGGNFGAVTRFTFRLHKVGPEVLFGPTFFSLDDAPRVLRAYAERAGTLPKEACVWANLMTAPPVPVLPETVHGTKLLNLVQCFSGDPELGRDVLSPLYGGADPLGSALAPRPFCEAQAFLDIAYEKGVRNYWRAHNHLALTPGLIDTLVELAPSLPTPASELLIVQLGGAVAEVPEADTAFPHRGVPFISTPGVRWERPADDDRVIGWLRDASERIAAYAVPGAYVNFITETDGTARSAYGANLARLSEIKRRYDPDNLFRINQNIPPA